MMTSSLVTILGSVIRVHNDRVPQFFVVCSPGLIVEWGRTGRLEKEGRQTRLH